MDHFYVELSLIVGKIWQIRQITVMIFIKKCKIGKYLIKVLVNGQTLSTSPTL